MEKQAKADQEASRKVNSVYDDGNIPQADLPLPDDNDQAGNIIPDEVPRKDGPGGEHSRKSQDQ